jgi:ribosomal protein L14E/L6E/L27E
MTDKNVALKMVVNGEERDVTYEELALSNNLAQEALVRLLMEKQVFKADELLEVMETVKKERYRKTD